MQPYLGYAIILSICAGLVYFTLTNKSKYYPYFLCGSALAMILLTTLAGPCLVGSDVHMEYFFAQYYSHNGLAGPLLFDVPQGTSIVNNYIAPFFPWPLIWTYKLVFPMLFALIPVGLYYIFQMWIDKKRAALASFSFIAFTPFFMEVPTIARQMLAEVVLVGVLLVFYRMKSRYRYLLLASGGGLVPLCHYSVAMVCILIFGLGLLIALILQQHRLTTLTVLLGVLLVSSVYFPFAQNGAVLQKVGHFYNSYVPISWRISNPRFDLPALPQGAIPDETGGRINFPRPDLNKSDPDLPALDMLTGLPFYDRYDTITDIALGEDFLRTNWLGKVYRVLQWLVLLLIFPGLWFLRKKKTYWLLAPGFGLLTVLCIIPGWANILNMTRFIHLTLLLGSVPVALALKPKYLLPLLILYFMLTSGLAFEVTKQPNIEVLTAPYNVALSSHRMDLGASVTSDDMIVRDYIISNELYPIYSDIYGAYILVERVGPMGPRADLNIQLPKTPRPLPDGYIFVRSRNVDDGTFVLWRNIGLRTYWPLSDWSVTDNSTIVFQSGNAKVLKSGQIEKRLEPSK